MKLDNIIARRTNKTIYRDGEDAIKVFDHDFSKADVLNEALNQARIEQTSIRIPKIKAVTTVDGKWAIISEFISGKTLSRIMEEDAGRYDEYLEKFVDLQLSVHSHSMPELTSLKEKMDKKISMTDLDATTRYELHTRLNGMPKHNKVCHGDFNPSNIIISDNGEAYILDWSHATRGNASADVARTYLLFCLEGKEDTAKKYLKLFCEKSNTARQYVEKWMPIVAASQSVKGKAEERDFLLSWVDVVDYE